VSDGKPLWILFMKYWKYFDPQKNNYYQENLLGVKILFYIPVELNNMALKLSNPE
jgi:hypothetical protein